MRRKKISQIVLLSKVPPPKVIESKIIKIKDKYK